MEQSKENFFRPFSVRRWPREVWRRDGRIFRGGGRMLGYARDAKSQDAHGCNRMIEGSDPLGTHDFMQWGLNSTHATNLPISSFSPLQLS